MGWGPESTWLVNGRKWVGSETGRDVYTPTDWAAGAEPKVGGLGKWHPLPREREREREKIQQRFLKTHQRPYLFQSYRLWKLHKLWIAHVTVQDPQYQIFTLFFFFFLFFGFKPQTRDSYSRATSSTYYIDVWKILRERERCGQRQIPEDLIPSPPPHHRPMCMWCCDHVSINYLFTQAIRITCKLQCCSLLLWVAGLQFATIKSCSRCHYINFFKN